MKEEIDALKHVSSDSISPELWDFIFGELREKLSIAKRQRILTAKGDLVLETDKFKEDCKDILCYVKKPYDQVLLTRHIATELCFYAGILSDHEEVEKSVAKEQRSSIILSGYMLYLLVRRPSMMPVTAGEVPLRYRDICSDILENIHDKIPIARKKELKNWENIYPPAKFFNHPLFPCVEGEFFWREDIIVRADVCRDIIGNHGELKLDPVASDACKLAYKLINSFDVEKRWRIMSKVWVEILSYAASHSKGEAHAKALSGGGELITFVWLLMIHSGIPQSGIEEIPQSGNLALKRQKTW